MSRAAYMRAIELIDELRTSAAARARGDGLDELRTLLDGVALAAGPRATDPPAYGTPQHARVIVRERLDDVRAKVAQLRGINANTPAWMPVARAIARELNALRARDDESTAESSA